MWRLVHESTPFLHGLATLALALCSMPQRLLKVNATDICARRHHDQDLAQQLQDAKLAKSQEMENEGQSKAAAAVRIYWGGGLELWAWCCLFTRRISCRTPHALDRPQPGCRQPDAHWVHVPVLPASFGIALALCRG